MLFDTVLSWGGAGLPRQEQQGAAAGGAGTASAANCQCVYVCCYSAGFSSMRLQLVEQAQQVDNRAKKLSGNSWQSRLLVHPWVFQLVSHLTMSSTDTMMLPTLSTV
jgi:hypothetical protein